MADQAHLDPEVILQHAGFVRSLARGLLRDEALVDDVVQETLLRALEKGPRKREALAAWLRTVTRNIAFKSYRGTARRRAREEEAARPERLPATFDLVAKGETLERLTVAVMELPEAAREIILLRYYEGLGNAEIARRLELGQGAVRMRIHRAQKMLTESLDRTGGDRGIWMSGLAVLAGMRVEDLRPDALESAAGTGLSGVAIAWTAAIGLALGALLWFAAPGLVPRLDDTAGRDTARGPGEVDQDATLAGTESRAARLEAEIMAPDGARAGALVPTTELDPADDAAVFPEGNLVGTVVDGGGDPVPGARVQAAWGRFPMEFKATTNDRGRFGLDVPVEVFENARSGNYPILLAATAGGSAPTRVWAWPMEWSADASEGAPDGDSHGDSGRASGPRAILPLRGAGGSLRGVVHGAKGGPLRGARIELGERTRFGLSFLGYQSAETANNIAPNLAAKVERGERLTFKGNTDMRGTLGRHVIDGDGHRSRLQPARVSRSRVDGSFHFSGIEPGVQRIRITAAGHAAWNGTVDVARRTATRGRFVLESEAIVSGTIRREDGLPLKMTLVHALQDDPWNATTVIVTQNGSFTLRGLRAGRVRIVAEERTPGSNTPPRIAEAELALEAGSNVTMSLTLHATPTRTVRFLLRDAAGLLPLAGQRVDLRGRTNPLLTVAVLMTDGEGRVEIPTETVVPCNWLLIGGAGSRETRSDSGAKPGLTVAVLEPPAEFALPQGESEEVVVEIDAATLTLCPVQLRVVSPGGIDAAQDVILLPKHDLFTHVGRPGAGQNMVRFRAVPAGRYRLLVPFHGLGWLAPMPMEVPAMATGGTFDLGTVRLPELGTLELRPATELEGSRWLDMTIQARQGDHEVRVFEGRIEIPASIPIAPGRYVLRAGRERAPYVREITVGEGQTVDVLWPVDWR